MAPPDGISSLFFHPKEVGVNNGKEAGPLGAGRGLKEKGTLCPDVLRGLSPDEAYRS